MELEDRCMGWGLKESIWVFFKPVIWNCVNKLHIILHQWEREEEGKGRKNTHIKITFF